MGIFRSSIPRLCSQVGGSYSQVSCFQYGVRKCKKNCPSRSVRAGSLRQRPRVLLRCSVAERFDLNLAAEIRNRERYPAVGDDFHAGRFRCVNDNSLLCEYCFFGKISFHEEPILGHSSSLCGTHSNVFFTAFPSKKHFRRIGLGDVVRKIFISFVARNHCNARYKRHGREQKLVHLLHIVRIVLYV